MESGARPDSAPRRTPAVSPAPTRALDRLLRWQDAGGTWEVIRRSEHDVTISLCRCDGGEEADRLTSRDPDLLAHVARRNSSESTD